MSLSTESGRIVSETDEALPEEVGSGKALRLTELGVDTLVCGAISRSMQVMIAAYGIRTVPFVAGDLREISRPGSRASSRRKHSPCPAAAREIEGRVEEFTAPNREGTDMNGKGKPDGAEGWAGRRGKGMCGGGGQGLGRKGGPKAAGPVGECVCPKCGYREPHRRGIPCNQQQCTKCGAAMTRE